MTHSIETVLNFKSALLGLAWYLDVMCRISVVGPSGVLLWFESDVWWLVLNLASTRQWEIVGWQREGEGIYVIGFTDVSLARHIIIPFAPPKRCNYSGLIFIRISCKLKSESSEYSDTWKATEVNRNFQDGRIVDVSSWLLLKTTVE